MPGLSANPSIPGAPGMPSLPGGVNPAALTPGNIPPLPIPGNVQNQLQQGQAFVSRLGNLSSPQNLLDLLGAGVTTVANAVGGNGASLIRTMVTMGTAVASGAAVGGPFGAIGGAVVGAAQTIAQLFQNGPPVYAGFVIQSSAGSGRLYTLVQQWQSMNQGLVSGNAQGESFAEYLIFKFPPSTTMRPYLLWALVNEANGADGTGSGMDIGTLAPEGMTLSNPQAGAPGWPLRPGDETDAQNYLAVVQPIDDAVLWGWAQPTGGATSTATYEQSFKAVAAAGSTELWKEDSKPIPGKGGMSVPDIMASALRRAPDPLYFAADLYIAASAPSAGQTFTLIMNTAAMSALATVLGMLAVGASTRAIVTELELQQHILALLDFAGFQASLPAQIAQLQADLTNATAPGSTYTPAEIASLKTAIAKAKAGTTAPPLPLLFRQLVEDYIALAHAEAKNPKATMADVIKANRPNEPPLASLPAAQAKHILSATQAAQAKAVAQATAQTNAAMATVSHFVQLYGADR